MHDWSSIWLSPSGWGFYFALYVGMQLFALLLLHGRLFRLALWPIPAMLLIVVVTYLGYVAQSNLWPIWLILASPVALVYLVALCLAALVARLRRR